MNFSAKNPRLRQYPAVSGNLKTKNMNTERLHKILLEIQKDFGKKSILTQLHSVRDNLTNQVNQPQQPAFQTALVTALNQLNTSLDTSIYNDFSPGWRQIIDEIGGHNLFGRELKTIIHDIFNRNQITPAGALQELNKIITQIEQLKKGIDEIVNGFTKIGMGKEELEPGQCEIGYCIPRIAIDNELKGLNKEISELSFILNTFSEVITGSKQEYKVKTISSSDFLLYVIIGLQVADVLSNAIERIINNYKTVLEIKILRNQLKDKGIPDSETKGIESYANSSMEELIKKIAKEVITEHNKVTEETRRNELENATIIALNKIANRIDKGFNIEVRVELLPPPEDKTTEDIEYKKQQETLQKIQDKSRTLEYINTSGQPILELNESTEKTKKK